MAFWAPRTFTTAIEMRIYLETWQNLIAALDLQACCERAKQVYLAQGEVYEHVVGRLTKPMTDWISAVAANDQPANLEVSSSSFVQLAKRFEQIHRGQMCFREKFLWWLHLRNPLQDATNRFASLKGESRNPVELTSQIVMPGMPARWLSCVVRSPTWSRPVLRTIGRCNFKVIGKHLRTHTQK